MQFDTCWCVCSISSSNCYSDHTIIEPEVFDELKQESQFVKFLVVGIRLNGGGSVFPSSK